MVFQQRRGRAGFGIFADRRVASVGQILDTAEWLNVGDQPNAKTLSPPSLLCAVALFSRPLAARAQSRYEQLPGTDKFLRWQLSGWVADNLDTTCARPMPTKAACRFRRRLGWLCRFRQLPICARIETGCTHANSSMRYPRGAVIAANRVNR